MKEFKQYQQMTTDKPNKEEKKGRKERLQIKVYKRSRT